MNKILIPMIKNGLWGFVDENFKFKIEPKFSEIGNFSCGWCRVKLPNKSWNFVNYDGVFLLNNEYNRIFADFINGYSVGRSFDSDYCGNNYFVINLKGEVCLYGFAQITQLSNGFWLVFRGRSPRGKDVCYYDMEIYDNLFEKISKDYSFSNSYFNCDEKVYFSDFENEIIKVGFQNETIFIDSRGVLRMKLDVCIKNISKNLNNHYIVVQKDEYNLVNLECEFKIIEKISRYTKIEEFNIFSPPIGYYYKCSD